ncbi:MAG: hypothetical protein ABI457_01225 [Hyphomicrobium sp.]|jgi:hypothetical protein
MRPAGLPVLTTACLTLLFAFPAATGARADPANNAEVEKPAAAPAESDAGYRPRWADPNAKPTEPGIENDPTPFNPAEVDANSDTLNNNLSPIDPD